MVLTGYSLWKMLSSLVIASFLLSTCGLALSPFLQSVADDLQTSLAAIANLLSFTSISWGVASLLGGAASDRFGRRPILVTTVLIMGLALLGFSTADNYFIAILWMILMGINGGAFTGTVYAAVSDRVESEQRGRALGWIITGQSLSMVFGVPLLTLLGAWSGWRGAYLIYGAVTAITAILVWWALPADASKKSATSNNRDETPAVKPSQALRRPEIIALLCAGTTERICFVIVAVYIPTYLQVSYQISLSQLALGLGTIAVGTVSGNLIGGYLADRIRKRILLYAATALVTAFIALPLFFWQPGLTASLVFGFAYTFSNSLGRPALMATLSEVPSEVRGAVMGMNVTAASVGWLTAAAIGGWLATRIGFHALGLLCLAAGITGCCLGIANWHLKRQLA